MKIQCEICPQQWQMRDKEATSVKKVYRLAEVARENLTFVYEGNC
jgi:pyruvate formate lyase activating enzyme